MKSLSTFDVFVNADLLINQAEEDEWRKEGKALCLFRHTDATGRKGVLWTSGRPRCLVEYGELGYHPIPRSAGGRRG